MLEPDRTADQPDGVASASVAEELVSVAQERPLQVEDVRSFDPGLASQRVSLAVGDEDQVARGELQRGLSFDFDPAAADHGNVEPHAAFETAHRRDDKAPKGR